MRVRVRGAGICGSDLAMIVHGPIPVTLGHEVAGELDDGTPVAIDPSEPCGTCDQCRAGRRHLCRTGAERTIGVGVDGGTADELIAPADSIVPLPIALPVTDACLVEPLAVAIHGLRIAGCGEQPDAAGPDHRDARATAAPRAAQTANRDRGRPGASRGRRR